MQTDESFAEASAPTNPDPDDDVTWGFFATVALHMILGFFWCLVVLSAVGIRELCFGDCAPVVTGREHTTELLVWSLGGLTWAAVFASLMKWGKGDGLSLGVVLSLLWFVVGSIVAFQVIVGSAR